MTKQKEKVSNTSKLKKKSNEPAFDSGIRLAEISEVYRVLGLDPLNASSPQPVYTPVYRRAGILRYEGVHFFTGGSSSKG